VTVSTFYETAHSAKQAGTTLNPNTVIELFEDGDYLAISFDLSVGQGATIADAKLTVDVHSEDGGETDVYGDDSTDAAALAGVTGDITGRTPTAAVVHWAPSGTGSTEIDVTSIVAEIVAEPAWESGNRLVLIIAGKGDDRDELEIDSSTTFELEVDHSGGAVPAVPNGVYYGDVHVFTSPVAAGTKTIYWRSAVWGGITPKAVIVMGTGRTATGGMDAGACLSFGMATQDAEGVISVCSEDGSASSDVNGKADDARIVWLTDQHGVNEEYAVIDAWDSEKIRFDFTTASSNAYYYTLLAMYCDDVKLMSIAAPSTNTTQAYTGAGFEPDALIGMTLGHASSPQTMTEIAASIGVATPDGSKAVGFGEQNNQNYSVTDRVLRDGFFQAVYNGADWMVADVDSFDSDGFTLDFTQTQSSRLSTVLALKGVSAKIVTSTQPTTDSAVDHDIGFHPITAIGLTAMGTSSANIEAGLAFGAGFWTAIGQVGTIHEACVAIVAEDNQDTTDTDRAFRQNKTLAHFDNTQTDVGSVTLSGDGTELTESWVDTDGTQREHVWFVLGDAPPDEGAAALMMLL